MRWQKKAAKGVHNLSQIKQNGLLRCSPSGAGSCAAANDNLVPRESGLPWKHHQLQTSTNGSETEAHGAAEFALNPREVQLQEPKRRCTGRSKCLPEERFGYNLQHSSRGNTPFLFCQTCGGWMENSARSLKARRQGAPRGARALRAHCHGPSLGRTTEVPTGNIGGGTCRGLPSWHGSC